MKIIISPAKKLNTNQSSVAKKMSFKFMKEASNLIDLLQTKSVNDIKSLMSLSDNLSQLNWDRFQAWNRNSIDTYYAIHMFQGDVYQRLEAESFSEGDMRFAENNLRILSGLYGLLSPMDVILPYRLEMGTKIQHENGNTLYDFWGKKLKQELLSEMSQDECLVNLASNEYNKALVLDDFPRKIFTPIFKDYKNGKLKIISFFAKRARGEMANFIIKNKITNPDDLKLFNNDGYSFSHVEKGNIFYSR